jgi:hypothetical protein
VLETLFLSALVASVSLFEGSVFSISSQSLLDRMILSNEMDSNSFCLLFVKKPEKQKTRQSIFCRPHDEIPTVFSVSLFSHCITGHCIVLFFLSRDRHLILLFISSFLPDSLIEMEAVNVSWMKRTWESDSSALNKNREQLHSSSPKKKKNK